jgi:nicotinamide-nucleotide adenylyltransferase
MIARWKPVHIGHAAVLEGLVASAESVVIGIGSSNRYNAKNPFTAAETADMLREALRGHSNYTVIEVPDLDDGPRWRVMVREMLGHLDLFVTANGYVRGLLMDDYKVVHPVSFVPPERRVRVSGTMVRAAMAEGGDAWRELVPPGVAELLVARGLVDRFRREFGEETRAAPAAS